MPDAMDPPALAVPTADYFECRQLPFLRVKPNTVFLNITRGEIGRRWGEQNDGHERGLENTRAGGPGEARTYTATDVGVRSGDIGSAHRPREVRGAGVT